jgi:hypothetical protein
MPSLSKLLDHTMVFVAAKGEKKTPKLAQTSFSPPTLPEEIEDDKAATTPIWHFSADGPAKFKDLKCIARDMGPSRMTVCSEVSFGSIKVTLPTGESSTLKLEQTFLLESYGLDGGRITPGAGRVESGQPPIPFENFRNSGLFQATVDLYPLEMNLDKSVLHVFVFEFPGGIAGGAKATTKDATKSEYFMPLPGQDEWARTPAKQSAPVLEPGKGPVIKQGQMGMFVMNPFRVVAFVSLVCCKERADFDPGGLLGGARMIPHVMVMANRTLKSVETSVTITRPDALKMDPHTDHCSQMNHAIESSLFSDNNDAPLITGTGMKVTVPDWLGGTYELSEEAPVPYWNELFAWYQSPAFAKDKGAQTYKVVRPDMKARTIAGALKKLDLDDYDAPETGDNFELAYFAKSTRRVARQGAFDNIHTAPTMKMSFTEPGVDPAVLTKAYMAPFCEHDCLHTHWRWGQFAKTKSTLGWSAPDAKNPSLVPGSPYAVAGSPMVPHNQAVDIEVKSANSYVYKVSARDVAAGTYTFVNHHGAAYAVSVVKDAKFLGAMSYVIEGIAADPDEEALTPDATNSGAFYWHLRNALTWKKDKKNKIVLERTKVLDRNKLLDG